MPVLYDGSFQHLVHRQRALNLATAMTEKGHEDQFLSLRLSACSVIGKQTVAATRGLGREAPIPVIRLGGQVWLFIGQDHCLGDLRMEGCQELLCDRLPPVRIKPQQVAVAGNTVE